MGLRPRIDGQRERLELVRLAPQHRVGVKKKVRHVVVGVWNAENAAPSRGVTKVMVDSFERLCLSRDGWRVEAAVPVMVLSGHMHRLEAPFEGEERPGPLCCRYS